MNLAQERLNAVCADLKLTGVANAATRLAQEASASEWSYIDFLDRVLRAETGQRQERSRINAGSHRRLSGGQAAGGLRLQLSPTRNKKQFTELASLAFVERGENRRAAGTQRCRQDPLWRSPLASGLQRTATRCAFTPPPI
jgi:DNA replication protein DnaC